MPPRTVRSMALLTTLSLLAGSQALSLAGSRPRVPDGDGPATSEPLCLGIARDPAPGFQALYGSQERIHDLWRRDCLPNGTNYCFEDAARYCSGCGTCCSQGDGFCCGSFQTCCDTGCCAAGETCSAGKCVGARSSSPSSSPSSTPTSTSTSAPATSIDGSIVTTTSTVLQTVTRLATQVATVVIAEVNVSTIVSTTEVTVTDAATQTNVVWVTVTAGGLARRTAIANQPHGRDSRDAHMHPTPPFPIRFRTLREAWGAFARRGAKLNHLVDDDLSVVRKAGLLADTTTTVVVTQTTALDQVVSLTITAATTSVTQTTIIETVTRALNAKFTVTVTSTLTLTARPPATQTVTNTASVLLSQTTELPPVTSTANSTPPPGGSSSGLSTPAIAGIAAGSAAFVIIAAAFFSFCWFRRRNNKTDNPWASDATHSYLNYDPELTHGGQSMQQDNYQRQPTFPRISFSPNPAHHSVQFQPPAPGASAAAQAGELAATDVASRPWHQRTSSGFTTLVSATGTPPALGPAVGKNTGSRDLAMATVSSQNRPLRGSRQAQELEAVAMPPAEADATESARWFEVDQMHGVAVGELEDPQGPGLGHSEGEQTSAPPPQQPSQGWQEYDYIAQGHEVYYTPMPEELDATSPGIALGFPPGDVPSQYPFGYPYPPSQDPSNQGRHN